MCICDSAGAADRAGGGGAAVPVRGRLVGVRVGDNAGRAVLRGNPARRCVYATVPGLLTALGAAVLLYPFAVGWSGFGWATTLVVPFCVGTLLGDVYMRQCRGC